MARYVQSVTNIPAPNPNVVGWRYLDSDSNLTNNDKVFISCTHSEINLTLPSSPVNASMIIISHVAGDITNNNIKIQALNKSINDYEILILKEMYRTVVLVYSEIASRWIIESDSIPANRSIINTSTNILAKNKDVLYIDTRAHEVLVTLPFDPIIGDEVTIIDNNNHFHLNACLVDGNSKKILAKNEQAIIDIPNSIMKFLYATENQGWKIFDVFANRWIVTPNSTLTNLRNIVYYLITVSDTLTSNEIFFVDTANHQIVVKLPLNPNFADIITIIDYNSSFDLNHCIVDGNGKFIDGQSDILEIDTKNSIVKLIYSGIDRGWLIFSITDSELAFKPNMLSQAGVFDPIEVTANASLLSEQLALVDGRTVDSLLLPALPRAGDKIIVFDVASVFSANHVTVQRNSSLINGLADNIVLDVDDLNVIFVYSGDTTGWITYSTIQVPQDVLMEVSTHDLRATAFRETAVDTNLDSNDFIMVNTSAAAVTLTLPALPTLGDTITVLDMYGNFHLFPCILNPNNLKIQGLPENLTINSKNECIQLVYTGIEFGWCVW